MHLDHYEFPKFGANFTPAKTIADGKYFVSNITPVTG